jgi:PEP-CTERM motif
MKLKSLVASVAAAVSVLAAPIAQADAVGTFQNVTFTYTFVDSNTFTLRISGLLDSATGNWANVTHIGALSFSDVGVNPSSATITPGGSFVDGGLSSGADGCNGNGASQFCFQFGANIAATNDNLFTIDLLAFTGTLAFTQNSPPHLKVCFTQSASNNSCVGSLLSADQVFSSSSGSSTTSGTSSGTIPEPGSSSLALLGLGMLGAAFAVRRKQAQR